MFSDQVSQVIKDKEKQDRDVQMKRVSDWAQQTINKGLEDFASAQNLNDYQKQELNKIVSDRAAKTMELFAQMRSQELKPEEFRAKSEAIRNENNEKVKQVLLPEQYDEYVKMENQFTRGMEFGGMGGGMGRPAPAQGNTPAK